MGDVISFGATSGLRGVLGYGDEVNKCSSAYRDGEIAGMLHGLLLGGAGGIKALAGPGAGKVYSHWIPDRFFRNYAPALRDNFGRSIFNGNYVTRANHYFHDPFATVKNWTKLNPGKWNMFSSQVDRIPGVLLGALGGLEAVKGINDFETNDSNCDCTQ